MTFGQRSSYWSMFGDICRAKGWANDSEHRREWHVLAGLGPCSAKEINHLKGFDAIKAVWLAVTRPNDVNAQLAQLKMARTRIIVKIRSIAHEDYIAALLNSDRFRRLGAACLEDLTDRDLEQFLFTISRAVNNAKGQFDGQPGDLDGVPVMANESEDSNVPF